MELCDRVEALSLTLHILLLVFVVIGLHAYLQLFDELLFGVLVDDSAGIASALGAGCISSSLAAADLSSLLGGPSGPHLPLRSIIIQKIK